MNIENSAGRLYRFNARSFDHFGDVVELAKKTGATVIGSAESADYLSSYHGVENVHGMNIGGKANFDFGSVKFVQAFHSSSFTHENGIPVYLGMPMGIVFEVENKLWSGNTICILVICHLLRNVIQLMYVLYQLEIILRWVLMMQVMLLMNLLNQKFLYRFIMIHSINRTRSTTI